MRESIILAPGLNGGELMKSLAMHGRKTLNLRICGAGELARLVLMRSGIAITETLISSGEEAAIVAEAVKPEAGKVESYFGKAAYADIQKIAGAIRKMRCLAEDTAEGESLERVLGKGMFQEKNQALLSVYRKYMQILSEKKEMDAILLIRKALAEGKALDADFYSLEEYPLNPLQQALIQKASGGRSEVKSIQFLFGIQQEQKPLKIQSFRNCYGASNEVESILGSIYAGKKLDNCTVFVTDTETYGQLFFDYALLYDIPISFGCGIPIMNSNPAKLAALYHQWMTEGFFGAKALREMLASEAFHKARWKKQFPAQAEDFNWAFFHDTLSRLRLTNDAGTNQKRIAEYKKAIAEELAQTDKKHKGYEEIRRKADCLPCLEAAARELALPAEQFLSKYAYIRKGSRTNAEKLLMLLDISAGKAIYEELRLIRECMAGQRPEDILPDVLKTRVCRQQSEGGKLHLCGLDGAFSSVRGTLYIAGLSAMKFPGSPKEDYLLLDADLGNFGEGAEYLCADGQILGKRERLLSLARLASGLGAEIYVSYAGLNVSELKRENASSLVYELFREESGENASWQDLEARIEKLDYFAPAISASRLVGEAYNKGKRVHPGGAKDRAQTKQEEASSEGKPQQKAGMGGEGGKTLFQWEIEKAFSPTALETFFRCQRAFLLKYLLGIPEPEDDAPFEIMSAADMGSLAHALMEKLGEDASMQEERFLALSEASFKRFLALHPPLLQENAASIRAQFLEMMKSAWKMNRDVWEKDPGRTVVLEEEDIHANFVLEEDEKEDGIARQEKRSIPIHGLPDRVEKPGDGSGAYMIVDFKSGRRVSHKADDIGTCLQILIYAYLMEQKEKDCRISGGEYRYIRLGRAVSCRYDGEMKSKLSERMQEFWKALERGAFPLADAAEGEDDPCRFCKYMPACGKGLEEGGASGYGRA